MVYDADAAEQPLSPFLDDYGCAIGIRLLFFLEGLEPEAPRHQGEESRQTIGVIFPPKPVRRPWPFAPSGVRVCC